MCECVCVCVCVCVFVCVFVSLWELLIKLLATPTVYIHYPITYSTQTNFLKSYYYVIVVMHSN